jgi:hypothetical protein
MLLSLNAQKMPEKYRLSLKIRLSIALSEYISKNQGGPIPYYSKEA